MEVQICGMSTMKWNAEVANGVSLPGTATIAGSKRRADESNLHDSERFTKRFNLLSLGTYFNQRLFDHRLTHLECNRAEWQQQLLHPTLQTRDTI